MPKENGAELRASDRQLYRLNALRLLELRDEPGARSLLRGEAKEILAEAVKQGLWTPAPRGPRGMVRSE
jgi:hypothetical protein